MSDPKFTDQDTEADESILWTANPHLASKIGAFILGLLLSLQLSHIRESFLIPEILHAITVHLSVTSKIMRM